MAQKVINIGDREIPFKATALTPKFYRLKFEGRDLFQDLRNLETSFNTEEELTTKDLELFQDIAYVMALQADPTIPENADDWLDTIDMLDIYEVMPELISLWGKNMETQITSKKNSVRPSGR